MASHERTIDNTQFGDGAFINQGDLRNVTINHHHRPPQAGTSAPCVIPYDQNRKVVHRPDISDKLRAILSEEHRCAALWGFGGSGQVLSPLLS